MLGPTRRHRITLKWFWHTTASLSVTRCRLAGPNKAATCHRGVSKHVPGVSKHVPGESKHVPEWILGSHSESDQVSRIQETDSGSRIEISRIQVTRIR